MSSKNFLLLTLFVSLSCRNPSTPSDTKSDSLQTKIIGLWGGLEENSPVWKIEKDSIYYFEEKKYYPCKLNEGNLAVKYQDHTFLLKNISVIQDTLIFYDESNIKTFAYRMKNN